MIRYWNRLSTDWKRWARWWIVLGAIVACGVLISRSFWICLFVLLLILPDD